MASILANRLVLNLRSFVHSSSAPVGVLVPTEDSNLEDAKIDEFFRTAYGRQSNERVSHGHHSVVDTILGDIGEPLRVSDAGDDDKDESETSKHIADTREVMC